MIKKVLSTLNQELSRIIEIIASISINLANNQKQVSNLKENFKNIKEY